MDKGQNGRYSKRDLELLRNTFGGEKEEELYKLRNIFLQLKEETVEISAELMAVLKKMMLPEPTEDVPLTQQADLYMTLGKINETHPEIVLLKIKAKDIQREYILQQFNSLLNIQAEFPVVLSDLKTQGEGEERIINMMAYMDILSYVDYRINDLKTLSNLKEETEDERKKRQEKDSAK